MNKKKFLTLFVVVCGLPLLLAQMVLSFGWFNAGVASKGQWLEYEILLLQPAQDKAHWRIAVVPQADCQQLCQNALYTVQQLYIGLGRKQQQVRPVLVGGLGVPGDFEGFSITEPVNSVDPVLHNYIVLVDPKGLALLRYPMPQAEQEMAETAKRIRYDLMKLLNYDRTSV